MEHLRNRHCGKSKCTIVLRIHYVFRYSWKRDKCAQFRILTVGVLSHRCVATTSIKRDASAEHTPPINGAILLSPKHNHPFVARLCDHVFNSSRHWTAKPHVCVTSLNSNANRRWRLNVGVWDVLALRGITTDRVVSLAREVNCRHARCTVIRRHHCTAERLLVCVASWWHLMSVARGHAQRGAAHVKGRLRGEARQVCIAIYSPIRGACIHTSNPKPNIHFHHAVHLTSLSKIWNTNV